MGGLVKGVTKALGLTPDIPAPPSARSQLIPFSSRGVSAGFDGGTLAITPTSGATDLTQGILSSSKNLSNQLGVLMGQVGPGVGKLTEAAKKGVEASRARLETNRRRVIGDLRENLARRRIAGSSFATDRLGALEAEFAQREAELETKGAELEAQAFLKELGLKTELSKMQAASTIEGFKTVLNQFNIESSIGAQLSTGAQQAVLSMHQLNQNAAIAESQMIADLIGSGAGLASFAILAGG